MPGRGAPARGALDQPALEQIRLVDVLDRVLLLADGDGQGREAHRTAAELLADRAQDLAVEPVQPGVVDLEQVERLARHLAGDDAGAAHLRVVAHALEQAIGHPRGAPAALGDGAGAGVLDLDLEQPGRAADDRGEIRRGRSARGDAGSRSGRASGVVISPARVVAPISVNGGSGRVTTRAPAPCPTVIGRMPSSMAG